MPYEGICKNYLNKDILESSLEYAAESCKAFEEKLEAARKGREKAQNDYIQMMQNTDFTNSLNNIHIDYDNCDSMFNKVGLDNTEEIKHLIEGYLNLPDIKRRPKSSTKKLGNTSKCDSLDSSELLSTTSVFDLDTSFDFMNTLEALEGQIIKSQDINKKFVNQYSNIHFMQSLNANNKRNDEDFCDTIHEVANHLHTLRQYNEDCKTLESIAKQTGETKEKPNKYEHSIYKELIKDVVVKMEEVQHFCNK